MISVLKGIFFHHWKRKSVSIAIAALAWFMVNYTLSTTRIITNIPIRVVNVPIGKTIEGLHPNGILSQRMSLTLFGNKHILENLTPNDFEVVIDASGKPEESEMLISKNNLVSLNPDIDLSRSIKKVSHINFVLRLAKRVVEKVPIEVTAPVGEAPRGYQLLDVWPYYLTTTLSGTEEQIKKIKAKGLKLTFNLSHIASAELDALLAKQPPNSKQELSYMVPDAWKVVYANGVDTPIEIDDPEMKQLRLDFVRSELLPLDYAIPISFFFQEKFFHGCNPNDISLKTLGNLEERHGICRLNPPLFASGVTSLFIDIVKEMIQIVVIAEPSGKSKNWEWTLQFINPRKLEDAYISARFSDMTDNEVRDLEPHHREEYLRNRFRSLMNRLQLFREPGKPLNLKCEWNGDHLVIQDTSNG